jgi:thioredoxin reductase (NADPH)
MNDGLLNYLIYVLITLPFLAVYLIRWKRKQALVRAALEKGQLISEGPKSQHPRVDVLKCIGCGCCADVCPEGDVLGLVGGKSAIINGHKCIGHGICVDACPVGGIELVMASPSLSADMPRLTHEYETNIDNLFIAGELGGLALVKNAVNQGRECVDIIAARRARANGNGSIPDVFDICVVGAGPAGISASLRAIEKQLTCITLEQDEIGGTVAKYPRQKLVMTSPVHFPLYGKFNKLEVSKENLLALWNKIMQRADLKICAGEMVADVKKDADQIFTLHTTKAQYRAHSVILSLGRRGTPRKLGIPGEELPKVMYSLLEAHAYTEAHILVVGGGDSAIEAAMGLAQQKGNIVILSYRKPSFSRIKERNARRVQECIDEGKLSIIFNSQPAEVREKTVLLEINGEIQEIPNDYVWIFAGGTSPNAFLGKIGVQLGPKDLTKEARDEAMPVSVLPAQQQI